MHGTVTNDQEHTWDRAYEYVSWEIGGDWRQRFWKKVEAAREDAFARGYKIVSVWLTTKKALNDTLKIHEVVVEGRDREGYPNDWARLVLMVSPEGEMHATGGDRAPGDPQADLPYIGLERMRARERKAWPITQAMCSVCGGNGKPVSGKPCICGGSGREDDEIAGLRWQAIEAADCLGTLLVTAKGDGLLDRLCTPEFLDRCEKITGPLA